jgi:hypothetical protein
MSLISGGTQVKRVAVASVVSGTTDSLRPCHFCKILTPRVIAFKHPPTAEVCEVLWACDYCVEAIRKMDFHPIGV